MDKNSKPFWNVPTTGARVCFGPFDSASSRSYSHQRSRARWQRRGSIVANQEAKYSSRSVSLNSSNNLNIKLDSLVGLHKTMNKYDISIPENKSTTENRN
jgi:hypothetical protein